MDEATQRGAIGGLLGHLCLCCSGSADSTSVPTGRKAVRQPGALYTLRMITGCAIIRASIIMIIIIASEDPPLRSSSLFSLKPRRKRSPAAVRSSTSQISIASSCCFEMTNASLAESGLMVQKAEIYYYSDR